MSPHGRNVAVQDHKHSEAEWQKVWPYIEFHYLNESRSARWVRQYLRQRHNFLVSERQLKTRFSARNWSKKLREDHYWAMSYVLNEYGNHVSFYAHMKGGQQWRHVCAAAVHKQVHRYKPPKQNPYQSIGEALEAIRRAGIYIDGLEDPLALPAVLMTPVIYHGGQQGAIFGDHTFSDDSDADSITSDSFDGHYGQEFPGSLQDGNGFIGASEVNLTEAVGRRSVQFRDQNPQRWQRLPRPCELAQSISNGVLPAEAQPNAIRVRSAPASSRGNRVGVAADELVFDLTRSLERLAMSLDQNDTRTKQLRKFLGMDLTDAPYHEVSALPAEHEIVVSCVHYYIQQSLSHYETLDSQEHQDRAEAVGKLRQMFDEGNPHVLPALIWTLTVMQSNDKDQQVEAFLEDCIKCVETCSHPLMVVLKPLFHMILMVHRTSLSSVDYASDTYCAAAPTIRHPDLMGFAQDFDGHKHFRSCVKYLDDHGLYGSPTYLIVHYVYGDFFLRTEGGTSCLDILLNAVQLSEKLLGESHLITVSTFLLASRAYQDSSAIGLSISYMQQALLRFTNCLYPARSFYCQLQLRFARLLQSKHEFDLAAHLLQEVFEYRRLTFGYCSGLTWEPARLLVQELRRQDRHDEAHCTEQRLRFLHMEEWVARTHGENSWQMREHRREWNDDHGACQSCASTFGPQSHVLPFSFGASSHQPCHWSLALPSVSSR